MSTHAHRPNIVFVVVEQQKASAGSCYGNPHVPAPCTDRLAQEGIVFENAYVTSPICTPSRCSFLTGLDPLVHQCTCHQNRAPFNVPLLPELLRDAGYYTGVIGHYERQRNLGRGFYDMVDFSDYKLGAAYKQRYSMGSNAVGWSSGSIPCKPEEGLSHLMTDRIIHMIDDAEATGAPFFLHLCYEDAHAPYFVPPPFHASVNPSDLPLPPRGSDELRPDWQLRAMEEYRTQDATDDDVRKVLAAYYGMIACADHNIGRVCDALEDRGLRENTWIILVSDHGDYAGEKGMFAKSESLYECLLHVPLIIVPPRSREWTRSGEPPQPTAGASRAAGAAAPGDAPAHGIRPEPPRGIRVESLVQTTDLFATILGIAGVDVPAPRQSHDLMEWVRTGARSPLRDHVFAQVGDYHGNLGNSMPGGITRTGRHPGLLRSVRTMEYSFIRDPDYGDEAYDLRNDPFELENLLKHGNPPKEVDSLRDALAQYEHECTETRNTLGVIPGPRGFHRGWE